MKMTTRLPIFLLLGLCTAAAQDKPAPSYPSMAPADQYRFANPDDEVAFARTAAPPSVSDHAKVLVLGKKGYQIAVEGDNGFVCFVERSWTAGFDDAVFWDPKIRAPNCFNAPAVRSVLPQYLQRTEWALAGATRQQMIEKTREAFAKRQFKMPEPGSFSFMLSKQGNLGDPANGGPWLPHVMLFVPHGQARVWGAGLEGSPIFGSESSPIEPTVLFIPVRRWSDGSPAPIPPEHSHQPACSDAVPRDPRSSGRVADCVGTSH